MSRTSILYGGRKTHFLLLITAVCLFAVSESVFALVPAFPGAEGFGKFSVGGRGGAVYEVTDLNDYASGAPVGSLRYAVERNVPRTIVFRVGGTISLVKQLKISKPNITIAGQTAPGGGICLRGYNVRVETNDVIIRYVRFRLGDETPQEDDTVTIYKGQNIILDHCSASWSVDEALSADCQTTHYAGNVTVQWCMISESLNNSIHSKGWHGYASLIRGGYGNKYSFHHNLYAHHYGRSPRPGNYTAPPDDSCGLVLDFRNNVLYNWGDEFAGYNDDGKNGVNSITKMNFIGNYYKRGINSTDSLAYRESTTNCRAYFNDNWMNTGCPSDPWSLVIFEGAWWTPSLKAAYKLSTPIPVEPMPTVTPAMAYKYVLAGVGALLPVRDTVDTKVINDVINGTGHIIDSEEEVGGWPVLEAGTPPVDTDHDGMPDTWETAYGLNLNDANDRNGYDIHADYTNLEVYLNSLVGFDVTPSSSLPQVVWTQRYNDTANNSDYAKDIAVDSTGNVIVTGYAKNTGTSYDFVTIKYTPDGNTVWTNTYNRSSSSPDYAKALAVDANSNVIVAGCGYTAATGYDGIIVKYAPGGSQLWTAACNYSAGSDDRFYDVATDANGNIYAVGRSSDDALLVKYTPDGSLAWIRTYNGSKYYDSYYNSFYQLVVDAGGDVYACGESAELYTDQDCLTAKYSPNGTLLWVQTYNGPVDGWDLLEAIALDSAGNVYVAGSVETETDSNYVTIKYSPDGNSLWTAFYGGVESGWDEAYAITVDSGGNVVVTGYSEGATSPSDIATVKYNSATGSELWVKRYNGAGNFTDFAEAIAADSSGNVYVHGRSVEVNSTDYVTICYQSDGTELWKMNYDGPAALTDIGNAMALDGNSVYVTGYSMNSAGNYDYATVKYTATPVNPCPAPPAGDLTGDCQVDMDDLAVMVSHWLESCTTPDWCGGCDMDESGSVNFADFALFADTWLECGMANPANCWQ